MSNNFSGRLFGAVIFWTALTTIFAWLPLVRLIGRPQGYNWGILGMSGEGFEGPFWIFLLLTLYVVTMLFCAFRGPRSLFYPMLAVWHLAVSSVVLASVMLGGAGAMWQGQGLRFEIPMWILTVPFTLFTAIVFVWVFLDHREGGKADAVAWNRTNSRRLYFSLALLLLAIMLFRAGTNYNWVTAAAIITTIFHWSMLIQSFEAAVDRSLRSSRKAEASASGE